MCTSFFTPVTPTLVILKLEVGEPDWTSGKSIDLIYDHQFFKIGIFLIKIRIQPSFLQKKLSEFYVL